MISISFSGAASLRPDDFFGEPGHEEATEAECAAAVRDYIHRKGIRAFLFDWNLEDDLEVFVGSRQVTS